MNKKDLHKIAPKLSGISSHKNGFEIPEKYFETIEDAVLAEIKSITLQNSIENNSFKTPNNYFNSVEDIVISKLKAEVIHKENTNEIPENYFDTIEENVLAKIKTSSKVVSIKTIFVKYIAPVAVAASLLFVFVLNYNSTTLTFDSLTTNEIENWIHEGGIDIDAQSIAFIYPEIQLDIEMYSENLSYDEVLKYLHEEDLEPIIYDN